MCLKFPSELRVSGDARQMNDFPRTSFDFWEHGLYHTTHHPPCLESERVSKSWPNRHTVHCDNSDWVQRRQTDRTLEIEQRSPKRSLNTKRRQRGIVNEMLLGSPVGRCFVTATSTLTDTYRQEEGPRSPQQLPIQRSSIGRTSRGKAKGELLSDPSGLYAHVAD